MAGSHGTKVCPRALEVWPTPVILHSAAGNRVHIKNTLKDPVEIWLRHSDRYIIEPSQMTIDPDGVRVATVKLADTVRTEFAPRGFSDSIMIKSALFVQKFKVQVPGENSAAASNGLPSPRYHRELWDTYKERLRFLEEENLALRQQALLPPKAKEHEEDTTRLTEENEALKCELAALKIKQRHLEDVEQELLKEYPDFQELVDKQMSHEREDFEKQHAKALEILKVKDADLKKLQEEKLEWERYMASGEERWRMAFDDLRNAEDRQHQMLADLQKLEKERAKEIQVRESLQQEIKLVRQAKEEVGAQAAIDQKEWLEKVANEERLWKEKENECIKLRLLNEEAAEEISVLQRNMDDGSADLLQCRLGDPDLDCAEDGNSAKLTDVLAAKIARLLKSKEDLEQRWKREVEANKTIRIEHENELAAYCKESKTISTQTKSNSFVNIELIRSSVIEDLEQTLRTEYLELQQKFHDECAGLRRELDAAYSKCSQHEECTTSLQEQLKSIRTQIAAREEAAHGARIKLEDELEVARTSLLDKEESHVAKCEHIWKRFKQEEDAHQQLQGKVKELTRKLDEREAQVCSMGQSMECLIGVDSTLASAHPRQGADAQRAQLAAHIGELTAEVLSLMAREKAAQAANASCQHQITTSTLRADTAERALNALEQKYAGLRADELSCKRRLLLLEKERNAERQRAEKESDRAEEAERQKRSVEAKLAHVQDASAQLRGRMEHMVSAHLQQIHREREALLATQDAATHLHIDPTFREVIKSLEARVHPDAEVFSLFIRHLFMVEKKLAMANRRNAVLTQEACAHAPVIMFHAPQHGLNSNDNTRPFNNGPSSHAQRPVGGGRPNDGGDALQQKSGGLGSRNENEKPRWCAPRVKPLSVSTKEGLCEVLQNHCHTLEARVDNIQAQLRSLRKQVETLEKQNLAQEAYWKHEVSRCQAEREQEVMAKLGQWEQEVVAKIREKKAGVLSYKKRERVNAHEHRNGLLNGHGMNGGRSGMNGNHSNDGGGMNGGRNGTIGIKGGSPRENNDDDADEQVIGLQLALMKCTDQLTEMQKRLDAQAHLKALVEWDAAAAAVSGDKKEDFLRGNGLCTSHGTASGRRLSGIIGLDSHQTIRELCTKDEKPCSWWEYHNEVATRTVGRMASEILDFDKHGGNNVEVRREVLKEAAEAQRIAEMRAQEMEQALELKESQVMKLEEKNREFTTAVADLKSKESTLDTIKVELAGAHRRLEAQSKLVEKQAKEMEELKCTLQECRDIETALRQELGERIRTDEEQGRELANADEARKAQERERMELKQQIEILCGEQKTLVARLGDVDATAKSMQEEVEERAKTQAHTILLLQTECRRKDEELHHEMQKMQEERQKMEEERKTQEAKRRQVEGEREKVEKTAENARHTWEREKSALTESVEKAKKKYEEDKKAWKLQQNRWEETRKLRDKRVEEWEQKEGERTKKWEEERKGLQITLVKTKKHLDSLQLEVQKKHTLVSTENGVQTDIEGAIVELRQVETLERSTREAEEALRLHKEETQVRHDVLSQRLKTMIEKQKAFQVKFDVAKQAVGVQAVSTVRANECQTGVKELRSCATQSDEMCNSDVMEQCTQVEVEFVDNSCDVMELSVQSSSAQTILAEAIHQETQTLPGHDEETKLALRKAEALEARTKHMWSELHIQEAEAQTRINRVDAFNHSLTMEVEGLRQGHMHKTEEIQELERLLREKEEELGKKLQEYEKEIFAQRTSFERRERNTIEEVHGFRDEAQELGTSLSEAHHQLDALQQAMNERINECAQLKFAHQSEARAQAQKERQLHDELDERNYELSGAKEELGTLGSIQDKLHENVTDLRKLSRAMAREKAINETLRGKIRESEIKCTANEKRSIDVEARLKVCKQEYEAKKSLVTNLQARHRGIANHAEELEVWKGKHKMVLKDNARQSEVLVEIRKENAALKGQRDALHQEEELSSQRERAHKQDLVRKDVHLRQQKEHLKALVEKQAQREKDLADRKLKLHEAQADQEKLISQVHYWKRLAQENAEHSLLGDGENKDGLPKQIVSDAMDVLSVSKAELGEFLVLGPQPAASSNS